MITHLTDTQLDECPYTLMVSNNYSLQPHSCTLNLCTTEDYEEDSMQ